MKQVTKIALAGASAIALASCSGKKETAPARDNSPVGVSNRIVANVPVLAFNGEAMTGWTPVKRDAVTGAAYRAAAGTTFAKNASQVFKTADTGPLNDILTPLNENLGNGSGASSGSSSGSSTITGPSSSGSSTIGSPANGGSGTISGPVNGGSTKLEGPSGIGTGNLAPLASYVAAWNGSGGSAQSFGQAYCGLLDSIVDFYFRCGDAEIFTPELRAQMDAAYGESVCLSSVVPAVEAAAGGSVPAGVSNLLSCVSKALPDQSCSTADSLTGGIVGALGDCGLTITLEE